MAAERKENKEKKEKKENIRQANRGKHSCIYAVFSLLIFALLIFHAYTRREDTTAIAGAIGLIDMMLTILGIRAGLKGRQEPEKKHMTSEGILLNGLILLLLVMIFLGGFS